MNTTIADAVRQAYSDCHPRDDNPLQDRNLNFRAAAAVPLADAVEILAAAVPDGYNNFQAANLKLLPPACQVVIAREGSVCIYVEGQLTAHDAFGLEADEFSFDPDSNETRIWWD
jgi:hypothetical protein